MRNRLLLWSGLAAVALYLAAGGGWLLSLPPAAAAAAAAARPIAQSETDAAIGALAPPRHGSGWRRPLIAVVGINDATETTDYLMPYGILRRADVADVVALATKPGPVTLYPALEVEPQATIAEFDLRHPDGADFVIVPAMSRDDDPAALAWIRSQADKGAIVIGVCAGAKIVGNAGLLDGRRATTHWYYLDELREEHPTIRYVADRRFVVDRGVATTTGITASMPMALTLIAAIAGRERAEDTARNLGLEQWDARHGSDAFRFTRPFALAAIRNTLIFWNHEQLGLELEPDVDEVSLALVADAWSRTYRSRAVTFAGSADARRSRNGLRIRPGRIAADWPAAQRVPAFLDRPPAHALDQTLDAIGRRYGTSTADLVAMQLEYTAKDRER
jgi:putative intracellular protease/amidase